MPEFTPEAAAIVSTIAENAANAVRQAYVLGAQQGGHAAGRMDGAKTLEEWRREMLVRYATPSWKRSLSQLVPACRFRPTEIYIARKSELKALQPENKSLSIGTHNALGAMRKDGVVVKLGDIYAPAIDGVPLSSDAGDYAQVYRPRNAYGEDYARLLGFTVVAWSMLESAIEDLDDALTGRPATTRSDRGYSARAERFAATVERIAPNAGPCTLRHLQTLAMDVQRLAKDRSSLAVARPCFIDGQNVLRAGITWDNAALIDLCRAFDDASSKCKELSYRLRLAGQPGFANGAGDALVAGLLPLVALGRVVAFSGARNYARALEQLGILDEEDVEIILSLARDIERGELDAGKPVERNARPAVEDVWNLARSPVMIRRAVAHRARRAGKVPVEIEVPLPGERNAYIPLLSVDGIKIAITAGTPDRWADDEVIVDLRASLDASVPARALVSISGTRVSGNEAAMRVAPWLVDEPA